MLVARVVGQTHKHTQARVCKIYVATRNYVLATRTQTLTPIYAVGKGHCLELGSGPRTRTDSKSCQLKAGANP